MSSQKRKSLTSSAEKVGEKQVKLAADSGKKAKPSVSSAHFDESERKDDVDAEHDDDDGDDSDDDGRSFEEDADEEGDENAIHLEGNLDKEIEEFTFEFKDMHEDFYCDVSTLLGTLVKNNGSHELSHAIADQSEVGTAVGNNFRSTK